VATINLPIYCLRSKGYLECSTRANPETIAWNLFGMADLPTFAQQKDTADARIAQQHDLIGNPKALDEFGVLATKQEEAFPNKNAAAVAALFTEDAVLVAPDGIFFR
jgi:hypothetical protein